MDCANISTNISIKFDPNIKIFEIIFTIPIILFGGLFNAMALWVFCCRMGKWTEARIYMINLAMADFTLVFTQPFITYFHFHERREDDFCKVIFAISCINTPMSNSIITLIALDRYIAIKHPLKARVLRSPRKAAFACLFLWLFCIPSSAIIVVKFLQEPQNYCFYPSTGFPFFIYFHNFSFFFIPLLILIFCSTQIIRCLKKKQNASLWEENLTRKALRIISVNMGTFIICCLPFNVSLLVKYGAKAARADCWVLNAINKTIAASATISHLNCCLDAICYYLVAKDFQEATSFLPCFRSVQSRSNLTQESQI